LETVPAAPRWRPLPLVAAVAAVVRLLYLAAHARSSFFTVPILDARFFDGFARALAERSEVAGFATGFRGALYPLLLALPYRWAGDAGIVVAQLAQHAAGVATAVAVAALAGRLFATDRAALAAGLLYALAPVPLFFEGELLAESLFLALVAALLVALERGATDSATAAPAAWFALAGAVLAAAAQLRPTAWILLAALPFVPPRAGRARRAAALLAALATTSLLLALAQRPALGALRLLPAASGINLYLGNRRGADGLVPRQELAVTHGAEYRDSVELFAETGYARARRDDPTLASTADDAAARDRYWRARAWRELAADPAGRLALLARKALVVLWNGEVPNNRDFAFAAREETPLLAWLPARFGLLLALAGGGLLAAPRSPGRAWIVAFALLHATAVTLFFVADRYRLPLYVPLAVLAGGGVAALVDVARAPRRAAAARLLAALAAGALLSFVDWTGARRRLPGAERDLYFRSVARAETGDRAGAADDARRAAALAPGDPYPHLQVATTALALDRFDDAQAALAVAGRLAPREPRVLNAAGLLYERRGELERAGALFREALRAAPDFAPASDNLRRVEGELASAQRVRRQ